MPLISVIVPVYNVEQYLSRCVESVLNQTFPDFELILVDDGSPDHSGSLCDEYALKDKRIVVIHQKNGGLSAARNTGIDWAFANSTSEWLTFIDSDDWVNSRYLEVLLNAAQAYSAEISVCAHVHSSELEKDTSNDEGSLIPQKLTPDELYLNKLDYANVAWAKLYKKSLFGQVRFPVGKYHEDMYTTHQLLFKCDEISFADATLYYYFDNPDGITRSDWTPKRLDAFEAWKKQIQFFDSMQKEPLVKQTVSRLIRGCGIHYRAITRSSRLTEKERRHYQNVIRDKLRYCISNYKGCLDDFRHPDYYYEIAYPVRGKIIKTAEKAKTKIKRVLEHG